FDRGRAAFASRSTGAGACPGAHLLRRSGAGRRHGGAAVARGSKLRPAMVTREAVEEALHRLYIGAGGTSLRTEDRKKASELVGFLVEIEHFLKATRGDRPFHLVDAAAGKAYVGLLAAEFFLAKRVGPTLVTLIEREARRAAACRLAACGARVGQSVTFTV